MLIGVAKTTFSSRAETVGHEFYPHMHKQRKSTAVAGSGWIDKTATHFGGVIPLVSSLPRFLHVKSHLLPSVMPRADFHPASRKAAFPRCSSFQQSHHVSSRTCEMHAPLDASLATSAAELDTVLRFGLLKTSGRRPIVPGTPRQNVFQRGHLLSEHRHTRVTHRAVFFFPLRSRQIDI